MAFDILLCRVGIVTFGADSLSMPVLLTSPKIELDISDLVSFRVLHLNVGLLEGVV